MIRVPGIQLDPEVGCSAWLHYNFTAFLSRYEVLVLHSQQEHLKSLLTDVLDGNAVLNFVVIIDLVEAETQFPC